MTEVKLARTEGRIRYTRLAASILVCEAIGGIGSVFTINSIPTWYASIQKPTFTPPNWIFGPIWTTLFFLMGVSLYILWTNPLRGERKASALWLFGTQLALNTLWTYVFFGLHQIFFGLVEILALWIAIAATIVFSYRVSRIAGLILIPYLAWVTIATILNYYFWVAGL